MFHVHSAWTNQPLGTSYLPRDWYSIHIRYRRWRCHHDVPPGLQQCQYKQLDRLWCQGEETIGSKFRGRGSDHRTTIQREQAINCIISKCATEAEEEESGLKSNPVNVLYRFTDMYRLKVERATTSAVQINSHTACISTCAYDVMYLPVSRNPQPDHSHYKCRECILRSRWRQGQMLLDLCDYGRAGIGITRCAHVPHTYMNIYTHLE